MKYNHVTPILFSSNVLKSIQYYTEILGFENSWNWGDPPTFGGVSKTGTEIYFCENGQGNPGTWLSVSVEDVDKLYETINAKGAKILTPPQTMEWGVREMLVEDPDNHKIRFGQGIHVADPNRAKTLPSTIKIIKRKPTATEHQELIAAVGWSSSLSDALKEVAVSAPVFSVVAEDTTTGKAIGCALLLGDNASYYYVKDVMVDPDWQNKRVGTALMEELINWLDKKGADKALVGLYTGYALRPFYEKFGFTPAYGMTRKVSRKEKED